MRPEPYQHLARRPRLRRARGARAGGGRRAAPARPGWRSPGRSAGRLGRRRPAPARAPRARPRGARAELSPQERDEVGSLVQLMAILVLNQSEVERLLDMEGCIEAMAGVLEALARGELYQPLRLIAFPPGETSGIGLMPAHRAGAGARVRAEDDLPLPGQPDARARRPPGHGHALLRRDRRGARADERLGDHGDPHRGGLCASPRRLLAREDSRELAILGSGVQGRSHIEAMRAVRPFERIRIASRTPANARAAGGRDGRRGGRDRRGGACATPTSSSRRRARASRVLGASG